MPRTDFYAQSEHSFVIDGVALEDFMEGDAISVEFDGDEVTATRALDQNRISFAAQRTGRMTVILKATSPSAKRLQEIQREQQTAGRRLHDIQCSTGTGERYDGRDCALQQDSFTTGGETMPGRGFVFVCAYIDARD